MDQPSWTVAHELLASCCTSLFESRGETITRVTTGETSPERKGQRVATFVGFSGNQLRGAIMLDLPLDLVAHLHPSAATNPDIDKDDLCDWAGELANQLLGRLKNGLSRHAITLQMSTPSTVWGELVHEQKQRSEGWLELAFESGDHRISIYFDGIALVPIDLTQAPTVDVDESPAEGDMMMLL
jgi:chemotaxis protein CheX